MQYFTIQLSSSNPWGVWMGVKHGDELEFTFGHPLNKKKSEGHYSSTENERQLSLKIMKYFTEFAKTGYFLYQILKYALMINYNSSIHGK